jgi:hypothetical protein
VGTRYGLAERFERQARFCTSMGSPLSGALLEDAAISYDAAGGVREFFERYPHLESLPRAGIRLLAALNFCALSGEAPPIAAHLPSCGGDGDARGASVAARAFIAAHQQRICELYERTPQTNEPARSTLLLAGLLRVAAATRYPVRLFEFGASAGLNTRLDRYRYEGDGWAWGDPNSALVLRNRERSGRPQALDAPLRIEERAACDLHPLDVTRTADRLYLRSFIWSDQLDRLERFDRACEAAATLPMQIEQSDASPWVERRFVPERGSATVVMHSIVAYYLTPEQREHLLSTIERAGEGARPDAPMAWLHFESAPFETRLLLWPDRREIPIARSDGHAQDIEWFQGAPRWWEQ